MGSSTRIRWANVARLAAGAIGCAALVMGLPALLERPKPPPLPEDIGLTQARQAPPVLPARSPRAPRPAERRPNAADPQADAHHDRPAPRRPHHHKPRARDREQVASPPASATVTAPAPAPPAPAPPTPPATPASPPPYAPPAPAPAATSSPSPPASSSPGGGATQSGAPSEFGFER